MTANVNPTAATFHKVTIWFREVASDFACSDKSEAIYGTLNGHRVRLAMHDNAGSGQDAGHPTVDLDLILLEPARFGTRLDPQQIRSMRRVRFEGLTPLPPKMTADAEADFNRAVCLEYRGTASCALLAGPEVQAESIIQQLNFLM